MFLASVAVSVGVSVGGSVGGRFRVSVGGTAEVGIVYLFRLRILVDLY